MEREANKEKGRIEEHKIVIAISTRITIIANTTYKKT